MSPAAMRQASRSLLVVVLVVAAGCASSPAGQNIASASAAPSARPTEPIDAASRTACATRVLTALVGAINARDVAAMGRVIGPGPSLSQAFQWVSMSTSSEAGPTLRGPGTNATEYAPEGARRLLLGHAEQGERWALGVVRASEGPSWHGGVDAEVHFTRQLADGRLVQTGGKTALSCIASTIYVLSLGDD